MTAPALRHDLRCPRLSSPDPSAPCTCSRGASVLRLPVGGSRLCAMCGGTPDYQVGPDDRACSDHIGAVLDLYFRDRWDGWQPATVVPISHRGGVA